MAESKPWQGIPTNLTLEQFEEFVLPHLHSGSRGPQPKLPHARDIKLHSETVVHRVSVERVQDRKG